MSAGRALAGVITPVYLALEGFSALRLSLFVVAVALTSAVLSAVVGVAADRLGRKVFLVVFPLLTAGAGVAFAFDRDTVVLFALGALGSFGRGSGAGVGAVGPYQPAESALVTDTVAPAVRNTAFGRLAFASSLGALGGGLLALLVTVVRASPAAAIGAYRPAYLATAAVSVVAGLLALGLRDPHRPSSPVPVSGQEPGMAPAPGRRAPVRPGRSHHVLQMPRRSGWLLRRLWVTNTFNGLAVGMFGPFITYWFFIRFGAGPARIGVLFAIINALTLVSALSAAGLARRWGLVRTVSVVRSAQALLLVPLALSPGFAFAGVVYAVRMLVQRVGLPLRQSYVLAMADPDERASVAALSNLPSQLAMSASPLLSGYLYDEVSLALPFELSALLQGANAASFWLFFRRRPPADE